MENALVKFEDKRTFMKIQVLASAVNQNNAELIAKMNIQTDAVLVNQCDGYAYE